MGNAPIVCKPTPWFLIRAAAMLVMFGVFAVLFYVDGSTGYRKKNLIFHTHAAFRQANEDFAKMNADGGLSPEEWADYASKQAVRLPEDRSILPAGLEDPLPWPSVLRDYQNMKPLDWHRLWIDYSGDMKWSSTPPERPYDARKIHEQWVVFWCCSGLAGAAAFLLLRTLRRTLVADETGVTAADGRKVAYGDMKLLDLRKWETKGLAFIEFEGAAGRGRIRIDGLTYGGFKKDEGEPAESLMRTIRSRFSGEILEYVAVSDDGGEGGSGPE